MKGLKKTLLLCLLCSVLIGKSQKIENIYVNLYTDSLKKGTYNYINIDGQLSNGKYIPLDSTHLIFWASAGKFSGNNLWIDKNILTEKIDFKITLRRNPALHKEFSIFIKKNADPELKTLEELTKDKKTGSQQRKN